MANFVQEKYNSMPEQVEENKKNINELIKIIKPVYKCVGSLNTSSISVAKSLTNADESTVDGWLLDIDGNLFKITGGDDYSLLLEYYSTIKGEKGDQGAPGTTAIDDNATAFDKTWSSQKISDKIDIINDKGVYYTKTQPTYDSGTGFYTLDEGYFDNKVTNIPIRTYDLLFYIDSNNKVKDLYWVLNKTGNNWVLDKIGEIGGKQLYQHNVDIHYYISATNYHAYIQITNDSNEVFNTVDKVKNYLRTHGHLDVSTAHIASGKCGNAKIVCSMYYGNNDLLQAYDGSSGNNMELNTPQDVNDTVTPL